MTRTTACPPHRNGRVSRRVFLHSTSVIPVAFASSELLRPPALTAMPRADFDGEAVEACESPLPLVTDVPLQPLIAQVTRLLAAAEYLGEPLPPDHQRELDVAFKMTDEASAVTAIQRVLDCHCLVGVDINPQMRVKVAPGPAKRELVEHGWRQFLVKVHNEAGTTAVLRGISSQARRLAGAMPDELLNLWLDLQMFDSQPLTRTLSGLAARVPHRAAVQPGSRPARGNVDVRCGAGDTGPRISQRGPDSLHHPACGIGAVAGARRNGCADGRGVRDSRRARPRVSIARQAAGARLRVPPAGLPG